MRLFNIRMDHAAGEAARLLSKRHAQPRQAIKTNVFFTHNPSPCNPPTFSFLLQFPETTFVPRQTTRHPNHQQHHTNHRHGPIQPNPSQPSRAIGNNQTKHQQIRPQDPSLQNRHHKFPIPISHYIQCTRRRSRVRVGRIASLRLAREWILHRVL